MKKELLNELADLLREALGHYVQNHESQDCASRPHQNVHALVDCPGSCEWQNNVLVQGRRKAKFGSRAANVGHQLPFPIFFIERPSQPCSVGAATAQLMVRSDVLRIVARSRTGK